MLSTMQNVPFSIGRIIRYGSTAHGSTKVTTWRRGEAEESTFHEVGVRAAAFANALEQRVGIDADQRVGTMLFNCAEHLEVMFAVSGKGAVFVPLNLALMEDQIAYIINHSGMEVIVADPRLADKLERILPDCPAVRTVVFIGTQAAPTLEAPVDTHSYESLLDGQSTLYDWPEMPEDTAAAMCYSTATTGAPKGVAYSHRSIWLVALQLRATDSLAITHGETFLCGIPIYHVLSWGVPFAAFATGTPMVLPDSDMSAPTLAKIIAGTHPRVAHGVPGWWIQLMVHYLNNPPERMSLTEIYVGGSPAPPALIKVWEERYGVDVVHVWGMTETSTVGSVARPPSGASGKSRWEHRVSQGRIAPNLQYRVVNDGEVVSNTDRNDGEIQVRGNTVAASYYQPESGDNAAVETFRGEAIPDASETFTEDGWLRTGDVASVTSEGFMTLYDRARDVIRSGGEWIFSAQLENLIMEADEVVECAVIGYPDEKWGERPLAVTVLHEDVAPSAELARKLRADLGKELPAWMAPEYWTFVGSIDKTSVGKFDKVDLREHLASAQFEVIALPGPGESSGDTSNDSAQSSSD